MLETFLKFSGIWNAAGKRGGAEQLVGVNALPLSRAGLHPAVLLFLGLLLAAGVWWLYRREAGELGRGRRLLAIGCRVLLLALFLVILARPVLAITTSSSMFEPLVVLIDTSSSMQIADARERVEDRQRAAIAAGATRPARIDIVKSVLKDPQLDLLGKLSRQFQLSVFTFDRQAEEVAVQGTPTHGPPGWIGQLEAKGSATALGDALRQVLVAKRGQGLSGILVISDGAGNAGLTLVNASKLARDERVPVYCYGVGITSPRDLQVSALLAPEVAFAGNDLPVTVRLRSQGYRGTQGKLVLRLDGAPVASAEVRFDEDSDRTVAMSFTPRKTGDFALDARIEPLRDEVITQNNTSPQRHVRIVDTRIKVLQIDQAPRWEFKYLQSMLMRDPRVEYHCWLVEAEAGAEGSAASPYLRSFPEKKEELFRYDLVLLGDVEPEKLPAGAMEQLNRFVADYGGGLVMIAGPRAAPLAYRRTPIEKMLPVEFDAAGTIATSSDGERPIRLELTPAGRASSMLRLGDTEAATQLQWEKLPPLYWTARISGPKPAAQVLAVDPDPLKAGRFGKMPVIALQQYGLGSVLYVGTDNTWRWRRNETEADFTRLWAQIVERMAMSHLVGTSGNAQLSLERSTYAPGDRVTVYARLYNETDLEPLTLPALDGYFTPADQPGDRRSFPMRLLPEQPGIYRGEFIAPAAGRYQVHTTAAPSALVEFFVADTQVEQGEAGLNEEGLRDLAQRTGGAFVREEDLAGLPTQLRHLSRPILNTHEVELWSTPPFLILALLLAGTEWWIRKRAMLK